MSKSIWVQAAGLGYVEMAREILDRYPAIVTAPDNEGRTPLHYAAVCRDGGVMYDLLTEYGADEAKLDNVRLVLFFEAQNFEDRVADTVKFDLLNLRKMLWKS